MDETLDHCSLPTSKKSRILIWRDEVQLATSPVPAPSDMVTSTSASSASSPSSDAGGGHLPTPTTTRSSAARHSIKRHSIMAFGILPRGRFEERGEAEDEDDNDHLREEHKALRLWRKISRHFYPRGKHHNADGMGNPWMGSAGGARAATKGEVVRTEMYRGLQPSYALHERDEFEPTGLLAGGSERDAMAERQERMLRAARLLERTP